MLERIHRGKTGALFIASATAGAMTAGASPTQIGSLSALCEEPRPGVPDHRRSPRRRRRSRPDGQGYPRGPEENDVRLVQRRGGRTPARDRAVRDRRSRAGAVRQTSRSAPRAVGLRRGKSRLMTDSRPPGDRQVDDLRQQLRALGYLDAGVDRFVLAPALGARRPASDCRSGERADRRPRCAAASARPRRSGSTIGFRV